MALAKLMSNPFPLGSDSGHTVRRAQEYRAGRPAPCLRQASGSAVERLSQGKASPGLDARSMERNSVYSRSLGLRMAQLIADLVNACETRAPNNGTITPVGAEQCIQLGCAGVDVRSRGRRRRLKEWPLGSLLRTWRNNGWGSSVGFIVLEFS